MDSDQIDEKYTTPSEQHNYQITDKVREFERRQQIKDLQNKFFQVKNEAGESFKKSIEAQNAEVEKLYMNRNQTRNAFPHNQSLNNKDLNQQSFKELGKIDSFANTQQ